MKLKRLKLKNYLRYTDFEYVFPLNVFLFGIVGRNGSGKTSLIEATSYSLFGLNRDSDRLVRNRYTSSLEMLVETEWIIGDHSLIVRRGITEKDKPFGEVYLNNKKVVSNYSGVTSYIESFLGLSKKIFLTSSFCKQGDFANLTGSGISSAERKNIFSDILGLKVYSLTEERIKNAIKLLESEMQTFTFIVEQTKQELKSLDSIKPAEKKEEFEEKKKNLSLEIEKINNKRDSLLKEYEKFHKLEMKNNNLRNLKDNITSLNNNIEENIEEVKSSRKRLEEIQQDLLEADMKNKSLLKIDISEELLKKKDTLQKEMGFLTGKVREIRENIERIKNLSGKCPMCLQEIKEESKDITLTKLEKNFEENKEKSILIEKDLNKTLEILTKATKKIEEINLEKRTYETKFTLLKKQENEKIEEIKKKEDFINKSKIELINKKKEISILEEELKLFDEVSFQKIKRELNSSDILKEKIQKDLEEIIKQIERYSIQTEKLKELKNKISSLQNKLQNEYSKNMEVLNILKKIFSRDGIPTSIMKNILIEIEEYSNYIIKKILPNFNIKFETQIETKKGDLRDGLDIIIYDNDKESKYSLLSGGEKDIINVSLNLGLAFLIKSYSKSPFDIIVLDEVFRHLDDINTEKLTEFINTLQEHFSQVFVISHRPFIQDIFSVVFNVKRDNLFSKVYVERNY